MKILWLTDFFPKSKNAEITGGVEARCFFVKKYFSKEHEIKILARKTPGNVWHPPSTLSIPERFLFTAKIIILGLLSDFDLVEGTNFANHLVAVFLGFLKQKPVVCWYPDVFVGNWIKNVGIVGIIGEITERLLFMMPNIHFIAISQQTKIKLISAGVQEKNISVVYCGVKKHRFMKKKKYDICVVSRFLKYKNIDKILLNSGNYSVVVIGQGPEEKYLKSIVSSKTTFLGHIPKHEEVLRIMASSRILCHLSAVEGFGIVVVESLSLGVPVVLSDIPVFREITKNGQGAVFVKNNIKESISSLLTDKKLYEQKVKEGLVLAKNYSWKTIAKETEKVYKQIVWKKL